MMNLTANQVNYLEVIRETMKQNVLNGNLKIEDLENNFKEVFTLIHNDYMNYLKDLRNNTEVKEQLKEEIWNELQGV